MRELYKPDAFTRVATPHYKPDAFTRVATPHYEPVPDPAWPSTVKLAIATVKRDWWMPKTEREKTLRRLGTALEISIRYWGADK